MELRILRIREPEGETVLTAAEVACMMAEEAYADRECMWVLHLTARNEIVEKELVSMGSLNATLATVREVFKKAIINSSASIVVVHNHPTGDPDPSKEDITVADRLEEAGKLLAIPVLDFIILGAKGYWSYKECKEALCDQAKEKYRYNKKNP